ncbi:Immunoglobulin I-set domain protein [Pedosphaera parvula Ellin514]|uniref:Immunoglobulin I-set domain protein n=2 Tax=Pedosphaera TaxID=1032526 RepID=B9XPI1_PEDPL|nr:Immunoglobulin I-set domain protein [Pedosphaera parvula Ellin514]
MMQRIFAVAFFTIVFTMTAKSTNASQPANLPGLISRWSGENNALDDVGGHDGTLQGGVSYTQGKVGDAFLIDGETGKIIVPDSPAFELTDSLTISCWLFINRNNGGVIFFRGDARPGLDPYALGTDGNGSIAFHIGSATDNEDLFAPITSGEWNFVTAVLDGTTGLMKIYINASLVAQTTTTVRPLGPLDPALTPGIGIGNVADFNLFTFDGAIDEMSLYNRALTQAEIKFLFGANSRLTIITQPQSQEAKPGSAVVFSVGAVGMAPLKYQWRFNGINIPGAIKSSLVIQHAQKFNAGSYSVVVSDATGKITSNNATLAVVPAAPPVIIIPPTDHFLFPGATAVFSVVARGSTPMTYQWLFNGRIIPGANSSTLVLPRLTRANAGLYSVVVMNSQGMAISRQAHLNILASQR